MNTKTKSFVSALALVVVVAGFSMTEMGRDLSNRIVKSIGAAAAGNGRYELQVVIRTNDSRSFEFTAPLTDREFRDLRNRPDRFKEQYLLLAKKQMAEKFGYHEKMYGADHYKMLAGPKATAFNIVDNVSHKSQDLFRDERRQDNFSQLYAN